MSQKLYAGGFLSSVLHPDPNRIHIIKNREKIHHLNSELTGTYCMLHNFCLISKLIKLLCDKQYCGSGSVFMSFVDCGLDGSEYTHVNL